MTHPDGMIYLAEVGSSAHGTNVEGSDKDYMGIFVETPQQVMGRTSKDHVTSNHPRSEEDDCACYSLRRFCKLAADGNPAVLNLFFAPPANSTPIGERLIASRHLFLSEASRARYMGYMQSQRQRLNGERGQKNVKRPELEEKYGFDTKYAYHVLRLGLQGIELMQTGKIEMPMNEDDRQLLIDVRNGKYSKEWVIGRAELLDIELRESSTILPPLPDFAGIDDLLVELHLQYWKLTGAIS